MTCDEGTVCDPSDGDCVECLDSEECGDGSVCLDRECVEVEGADRAVSDWGDGETPPSCDQCTEDEECRDFAFTPEFCALSCNEALLCPEGMFCCSTLGGQGQICVDERNRTARALCQ